MDSKKSFFAPIKAWKYLFKKPVSVPMEDIRDNPRISKDNYRGFHVNDWDKCVGCGTCSEICPTAAIEMVKREELPDEEGSKPERPVIDYGRCCFCALCVDICTTESLNLTKEYLLNSPDPEDYYYMPDSKGIHGVEHEIGYRKTEESDLLDLKRVDMKMVEVENREGSFIEVIKGYSKEEAIAEAARCVECGICTKTCPAHMNIPEYIRAVWEDDLGTALEYLYKTNPLPGVCGSVCTHRCEFSCVLSERGEAISIRWLKRYIVENAPEDVYDEAVLSDVIKDVDGRIAVVGSGPAGLSAAYYLRTLGYKVDIFESKPLTGGVMRYGIPKYRLPDDVLDKDVSYITKLGVNINTGVEVGKDITVEELREKYDALYVATGLWEGKVLRIDKTDHKDVHLAVDFLASARDYARNDGDMPEVSESAVVIGGGDVAFDVARTLIRLQNIKYGKSDVKLVARRTVLRAGEDEIEEGQEEGIEFKLGFTPMGIVEDEKTKVIKGLRTLKTDTIDSDGNGEEHIIKGSQVYMAIGQDPIYSFIPKDLIEKIEIDKKKIVTNEKLQIPEIPWLFVGGDILNGPDIIHAVKDGYEAAKGIDEYLMTEKKPSLATE